MSLLKVSLLGLISVALILHHGNCLVASPKHQLLKETEHQKSTQHHSSEQPRHFIGLRQRHFNEEAVEQDGSPEDNSSKVQHYGSSFVIWFEIIIPVMVAVFLIVTIGYVVVKCTKEDKDENNSQSWNPSHLAASRMVEEEGEGEETKRTNIIKDDILNQMVKQ